MASPALPGLVFCFIATVLLVFASVSSPTWEAISFLNVFSGGRTTHFGVFGYTGSKAHVGYNFPPSLLGYNDSRLNSDVIHNLTFVMVLHPIAAGLAGLAVIFGLCGAAYSRIGTIFMSLTAALATVITLVVWVIDMVLWGIARNRINNHGPAGTRATYGNANWLVLGAFVALLFGFCSASLGCFGRFRRTSKV